MLEQQNAIILANISQKTIRVQLYQLNQLYLLEREQLQRLIRKWQMGLPIIIVINMDLADLYKNQKRLTKINKMTNRGSQSLVKIDTSPQIVEKVSAPTLPTLSLRYEAQISPEYANFINHERKIYTSTNEDNEIPGYNFQSLFRKKSHIRLARKKNKEQNQKKNYNIRVENSDKQTKNIQKGHWSHEQNKLYHWFLEIHNRHFIHKHLRRSDKIFKSMASFIRTRQAQQCRSHHQKMQKKYHNFYQILLKLRMEYYITLNPQILKQELEQNGYAIKQFALISEHQLKNENVAKFQSQYEQRKSENSIKNSIQNDQSSSKHEHSLMGENYEKGLEFNLKYQ